MADRSKITLTTTAEQVGTTLGHLAARVDRWRVSGQHLVRDIRALVIAAEKMLEELGHADARGVTRRGRKAGRQMSDETQTKLRQVWKLRRKVAAAAEATAEHAMAAASQGPSIAALRASRSRARKG